MKCRKHISFFVHSASKLVLPTPGGPVTTSTDFEPPVENISNCFNSLSRPTKCSVVVPMSSENQSVIISLPSEGKFSAGGRGNKVSKHDSMPSGLENSRCSPNS